MKLATFFLVFNPETQEYSIWGNLKALDAAHILVNISMEEAKKEKLEQEVAKAIEKGGTDEVHDRK
jgi:hypothetical protein